MPDKPTISKRQQAIDRLYLQLDIQSRAIRMTRSQREDANKIMKKIQNGQKMSDKVYGNMIHYSIPKRRKL